MKRKILLYILTLIMLLSFTACGESETSSGVVSSQDTGSDSVSNESEESVQSEESEDVSEEEEKPTVVSFKGEDDSYERPPHMGEILFSEKVIAAFDECSNGELFALKLRWQWKEPIYAGAFTGFIYEDDSYTEIFGTSKLEHLTKESSFTDVLPKFLNFLAENDIRIVNIDDSRDVYILVSEEQIKNLEIPDYTGIYAFLHDAADFGYDESELEYFNYSNESEESVQSEESTETSEDTEKKTIVSFKKKDDFPCEVLPTCGELELLPVILAAFREYNDGEYFLLRLPFAVKESHEKIYSFTYKGINFRDHYGRKEWTDEAEDAFWEYIESLHLEFLEENEMQVIDTESGHYVLATEEQILSLDVPDYLGFYIFLDNAANFGYDESEIEYFEYK